MEAKAKESVSPLDEQTTRNRPSYESKRQTISVADKVGNAIPYVQTYKQLDNKEQVVALINDVCFTRPHSCGQINSFQFRAFNLFGFFLLTGYVH